MKMTKKPGKNRIVIMVLAALCILALAGVSLGAYTRQASMRGVLRNRDNEAVRFSSNYLQSCAKTTTTYTGKPVVFSADDKKKNTLSIDLYVYNYANGNSSLISQKDITYTMKINFSGGKGADSDYKVTYKENETDVEKTGLSCTIPNQTLTGRAVNFYKYTITFPASDLDQVKITAVAEPTNMSLTNNQILAAILVPCTGTETQLFSAKGEFIDTAVSPKNYDGFNYEISISSGKSNDATVSWDPDIVEIDKFFLVTLGKSNEDIQSILTTKDADGMCKLIFSMDQSNGTGDYLIPFYIKDKNLVPDRWESDPDAGEKGMDQVITFTAHQATQQ